MIIQANIEHASSYLSYPYHQTADDQGSDNSPVLIVCLPGFAPLVVVVVQKRIIQDCAPSSLFPTDDTRTCRHDLLLRCIPLHLRTLALSTFELLSGALIWDYVFSPRTGPTFGTQNGQPIHDKEVLMTLPKVTTVGSTPSYTVSVLAITKRQRRWFGKILRRN